MHEIEELDHTTYDKLYFGMSRILAKKMLRSFTIADYPHIQERNSKRKLHRDVFKAGYPENFKKQVLKTTDLELI